MPPSPTPPTTRPAKGQAKPRRWKQARDAQRQVVKIKRSGRSEVQLDQAKERADAKAATKAERRERYKDLEELRTRAVQAGLVEHGLNPVDCLQRLIDDAMIDYMIAAQEHDALLCDPGTDRQPKLKQQSANHLLRLRREAAYYAGLSVQYNLQDRQTRVQEGRLVLMVALLQRTLRHPDINLSPDKIKLIPRIMQQNLATLRDQPQAKEK